MPCSCTLQRNGTDSKATNAQQYLILGSHGVGYQGRSQATTLSMHVAFHPMEVSGSLLRNISSVVCKTDKRTFLYCVIKNKFCLTTPKLLLQPIFNSYISYSQPYSLCYCCYECCHQVAPLREH
uniref:Uncharacterized protein n=1 Tax=Rhipicephalus zambeziensis TaxID=60191 RepID=A0A224YIM8_9ACAR